MIFIDVCECWCEIELERVEIVHVGKETIYLCRYLSRCALVYTYRYACAEILDDHVLMISPREHPSRLGVKGSGLRSFDSKRC